MISGARTREACMTSEAVRRSTNAPRPPLLDNSSEVRGVFEGACPPPFKPPSSPLHNKSENTLKKPLQSAQNSPETIDNLSDPLNNSNYSLLDDALCTNVTFVCHYVGELLHHKKCLLSQCRLFYHAHKVIK